MKTGFMVKKLIFKTDIVKRINALVCGYQVVKPRRLILFLICVEFR